MYVVLPSYVYNVKIVNKLSVALDITLYIIPHLHNLFLFQCDVTRSLNRYESLDQTVY